MARDVFISYSTIDKSIADVVCSVLEANYLRCWIAPRDITPGTPFAEAIIDAINNTRVFVLIFSSNSNRSNQVMKEVERAVHHGIPIIPLRIEDVPMSKQLEYYTSNIHWLDALTPPLEDHLKKLYKIVHIIVSKDDAEDVREVYMLKLGEKHSSWEENKKVDNAATGKEESGNDQPISKIDKHREESLTTEYVARPLFLKRFLMITLVFSGIALLLFAIWLFGEQSKHNLFTPDHVKKGYGFLENMEYEKAYEKFSKALEKDADSYSAQIGIATILIRQDNLEDAIEELQNAIDMNDQEPHAYKIMGEIFTQREEWDKAMFYFKKYLEIIPDSLGFLEVNQIIQAIDEQFRSPVIQKEPISRIMESETDELTGKLKAGIDAFNNEAYVQCLVKMEEIINTDPENIYARHYLSEARKQIDASVLLMFETAQNYFEKGFYEECIEQLENILDLEPDNVRTKEYLGLAKTNLSQQQILLVVHQYVRSVENNNLLNFYQKKCLTSTYEELKKDIELTMRVYRNLFAEVSNISIRFMEISRAEVTFFCLMTGVSAYEEKQQIVFEGHCKWMMVQEDKEWKIEDINFLSDK